MIEVTIKITAESGEAYKKQLQDFCAATGQKMGFTVAPSPEDPETKGKRGRPAKKAEVEPARPDPAPSSEESSVTSATPATAITITVLQEMIRKVAAKHDMNKARELLQKVNAQNLKQVKPEDYGTFFAHCQGALA